MSLTQFSMVEELAFLIKDNLSCKHLVLSIEEMLVDFLQDDTSLDGVLELEPMNPYNRLLLHRLADIFGFSHQSIGEGDDRHLVLKRCEDTSIPSILVADMLFEQDGYPSPTTSELLSRRDDVSVLKIETSSARVSLEDREAAYLEARKRIFSKNEEEGKMDAKERPRHNPVVARRMIVHALGQKIIKQNNNSNNNNNNNNEVKNEEKGQNVVGSSVQNRLKEEHIGAAKRMFANALRKDTILSKGTQNKQMGKS